MKLKSLLSIFFHKPQRCPKDYAAGEAESQQRVRSFSANSQCGVILDMLKKGKRVTALSAMGADRRLREVRKHLRQQGVTVKCRTFKSKSGGLVKEFWLDPEDLRGDWLK
ncbi:hypothetical protein N5C66_03715 [Rhizobium pusense]|uniref:Uncharacterized protein n=1 Tax=Agrobacterium genomosp. 2 str. CFBP 5494 TaxID=1183436 RepID=A0A9W5AXQ3_9HYPH|nr:MULTISPECIES: hypothetical protein [Rhizobium/Agrobacterium group]MDH0908425.1 hypothetical protein [Agrobacterium pusense]MDH1094257.1 hypothetical protein [Agrobacterium pusense]MDH1110839.1 hypothetical protein [Agrobacterium pusense]MDH2192157.1 hypothetical protein [Agrobacterium pusense]CAD7043527.1 hypothetical protein RP007_01035 [Rhizobium sp. P007]